MRLEQVRDAIKAVWPWAQTDLNRPFVVIAVNNEDAMRALLPRYWEQRTAVRPTSVWVSGYAMLGEVRSLLGNTEAVGLVVRATLLEPAESNHRLIAARILMRPKRYDEALKAAQAAAALASTPEEASRARELQQAIERAK